MDDLLKMAESGLDLARDIWQRDEKVQICFLTSFEIYENEARKVFNNLKSHCFIRKPMLPSALIAHIEKHFMG